MATTVTILSLTTVNLRDGTPQSRAASTLVSDGTNTYRLPVGGIPLPPADAQTYLNGIAADLLAQAVATGTPLPAQDVWQRQQSPLVAYYASIIKSLYDDVDNVNVTIDQLLTNAANIIATNTVQQSKFNAYRTRMGLGGSIATMTTVQKQQLLVLGLEWCAAGLAVSLSLNGG